MIKAEKWNPKIREYEPTELPAGACLYTQDMEQIVSCARCAEKGEFGRMITSRFLHNRFGLGYSVCRDCYNQEVAEEAAANKEETDNAE